MKNSNKMNEDLLRPINLSACLIFAHTHTHSHTHTPTGIWRGITINYSYLLRHRDCDERILPCGQHVRSACVNLTENFCPSATHATEGRGWCENLEGGRCTRKYWLTSTTHKTLWNAIKNTKELQNVNTCRFSQPI